MRDPSALTATTTPSDAELVGRARAGCRQAFGHLYDRHAPVVHAFLQGLGLALDGPAVEDALQETFLRLYARLGQVADPRRVRCYLLGIARHVAIDAARREVRDVALSGRAPLGEAIAPEPGAADQAILAEREVLVAASLRALPPEVASVLALRHRAGLTMRELALALGCSVPTARGRLRDAARRLAAELRRRGIDPEESA